MKTAVVKASQLGSNCWSSHRFTGGECKRLEECKYPEKQTCRAYIKKSQTRIEFAPGSDVGHYQI